MESNGTVEVMRVFSVSVDCGANIGVSASAELAVQAVESNGTLEVIRVFSESVDCGATIGVSASAELDVLAVESDATVELSIIVDCGSAIGETEFAEVYSLADLLTLSVVIESVDNFEFSASSTNSVGSIERALASSSDIALLVLSVPDEFIGIMDVMLLPHPMILNCVADRVRGTIAFKYRMKYVTTSARRH